MKRSSHLHAATNFTLVSILTACAPQTMVANADTPGGEAERTLLPSLALTPLNTDFRDPWGTALLPSGELLVTERYGTLFKVNKQGQKTEIIGLPRVHTQGQGGLLDVAVHPEFDQNSWLYFSYAKPLASGRQTALARAQLNGDKLVNWTDLYIGNNPTTGGRHYGSRIALHNGYVFFTIGDRGDRDRNPQDLSRDGGKVYRLHDDGTVPEDNPFVDTEGALAAIWSYGHRNPQGLHYDSTDNTLWLHEHGPKGGDELNKIEPGHNYGWPLATFGVNYSGTRITHHATLDGMTSPEWHWTPSIAPSGLTQVSEEKYPSLGTGLLAGSLKFGELHFKAKGQANFRVVVDGLQRVRSLTTAADGTVYLSINNAGVFTLSDQSAALGD